jgi:DNA replication and repair protein RecF
MTIDQLYLLNFKNYREAKVSFSTGLNVLVGKNGSGKTNLLDAIYFLSFTKGAISSSDAHYIKEGESQAVVRGLFTLSKSKELSLAIQAGQKKIFREDGLDYLKLSEHLGKYPVVLVVPDDADLVKDSSEARRKFFDSLISQLDKTYLENLIQYNHCLKQRNSLLKMFAESGRPDWALIESYDAVLVPLAQHIFQTRAAFLQEFLIEFQKYYQWLVADETVNLQYDSSLIERDFRSALIEARAKDIVIQRTSVGIHRDDFVFSLGNGDLKRLGSQGQQKSFVLAMKLAQMQILKTHKGFYPILLLDDVFDKLDTGRIERLLKVFSTFGQIFLTDARPDRTQQLLETAGLPKKIFLIENGQIAEHA